MKEGQYIIYFSTESKETHNIFTVDKDNFSIYPNRSTTELEQLLSKINYQHSDPNRSPLLPDITLEKILPISSFPENSTLYIVSNHHLIPSSLSAIGLKNKQGRTVAAINHYYIQHIPSATVLSKTNIQPSSNEPLNVSVLAASKFAPQENKQKVANWSDSLNRLAYSEHEALSIRKAMTKHNVNVFLAGQSNKETLFSKDVRSSDILHIATHGFYHPNTPANIGIALSSQNEDGEDVGGFVTLTELYSQQFESKLVVISGCETGLGNVVAGPGVQNLARAFITQGANNVISTIWPVSDKASALFMQTFYQQLNEEVDIAKALRQTQIQFSNSGRYRHPFYWAGYHLTTIDNTD